MLAQPEQSRTTTKTTTTTTTTTTTPTTGTPAQPIQSWIGTLYDIGAVINVDETTPSTHKSSGQSFWTQELQFQYVPNHFVHMCNYHQ
eukprot:1001858-Amphidinium_carterae.4